MEPVVKIQPVHFEILFRLLDHSQTGLNVNAIYRELVARNFGRNKKLILEAIGALEKGKLLETIKRGKTIKRVKQKKIKNLTTLGYELLRLDLELEDYTKSCTKLEEVIKQYFDIKNYDDKNIERNVLLDRGWEAEEIQRSISLFQTSRDLLNNLISPFQIISVILIRYILVLQKINNNENAKAILDHIIMKYINKYLSNTMFTDIDNTYSNLVNEKISFVTDLMNGRYYANRFTNMAVEGVLSSLFDALDVPCGVLKSNIIKTSGEYFEYDPPPPSYMMYQDMCLFKICDKMKEKYGLQFNASDLELWHAHISECNIQAQIKRGFATTVSVKIDGGTEHSFLDLRIVDPDNNQLQCPDPSKWEYDSDTGKFDLEFNIPLGSKLGEYNAVILLCRDVKLKWKGAPKGPRHILDFQEKTFGVIV